MSLALRIGLLRHAKSDYPSGVSDHERPLAPRGRRDAPAAGRRLAELDRFDLVLCSGARRARQTWELAAAELPADRRPGEMRVVPQLYGATPKEVLELLNGLGAEVGSVLLVGHEPTMSGTVELLADGQGDAAAWRRLRLKYPTCGLAELVGGRPLRPAGGQLLRFEVPRA